MAELWALPAFRQLWLARLLGVGASQMLSVALGWLMYEHTGSAWDLGLIGLLQFGPALALMLVAGQVVDTHHRGRILAASFAAQAGLACALILVMGQPGMGVGAAAAAPVAATSLASLTPFTPPMPLLACSTQAPADTAAAAVNTLPLRPWLLAASLLLGAVRAFQMPAQQALLPLLVPATWLPRAMAFSSSGLQAAIIAGPALGGFIIMKGAPSLLGCCALLFATASLLALRLRYRAPPADTARGWASLLAGVRHVAAHRLLLGALSLDLVAVLLGGATALLPIFAKDILQVGPWGLGLLRSAPAAGALLMALLLTRWPLQRRAGPRMLWAVGVYGAAMLVFAISRDLALSLLALAVSGGADMVSVVVRQSLVQLHTPDALRGRVSAVNGLFIGASSQLGEFESGATAALLGPVGSVLLGGVGAVGTALLWTRLFPALAQHDQLTAPAAAVKPADPP